MNRARLAVAATFVTTTMYVGAALAAQATQAPPMTQVLAGKKFTPPVRGEALVEFTQPVTKAQPGKNLVLTTIKVELAVAQRAIEAHGGAHLLDEVRSIADGAVAVRRRMTGERGGDRDRRSAYQAGRCDEPGPGGRGRCAAHRRDLAVGRSISRTGREERAQRAGRERGDHLSHA